MRIVFLLHIGFAFALVHHTKSLRDLTSGPDRWLTNQKSAAGLLLEQIACSTHKVFPSAVLFPLNEQLVFLNEPLDY